MATCVEVSGANYPTEFNGQWKLVAMEDQPWELYDLVAYRTPGK